MIKDYLPRLFWILGKVAVTLACIITLQNLIHNEGFYIPLQTLIIMSVLAIIGMKLWVG